MGLHYPARPGGDGWMSVFVGYCVAKLGFGSQALEGELAPSAIISQDIWDQRELLDLFNDS